MQYYIGNSQCKACRGLGFEPCPLCVGYEAKLTPSNPCEGPASLDDLDPLISTMRWLRGFPDSRARKARRCAISAMSKSSHQVAKYVALQNLRCLESATPSAKIDLSMACEGLLAIAGPQR